MQRDASRLEMSDEELPATKRLLALGAPVHGLNFNLTRRRLRARSSGVWRAALAVSS